MADLHAIEPPRPSDRVVAYLEALLERARDGQIAMIAAAYVYTDFSTGHGHSELTSNATMVGALAGLQAAIVREMIDG